MRFEKKNLSNRQALGLLKEIVCAGIYSPVRKINNYNLKKFFFISENQYVSIWSLLSDGSKKHAVFRIFKRLLVDDEDRKELGYPLISKTVKFLSK